MIIAATILLNSQPQKWFFFLWNWQIQNLLDFLNLYKKYWMHSGKFGFLLNFSHHWSLFVSFDENWDQIRSLRQSYLSQNYKIWVNVTIIQLLIKVIKFHPRKSAEILTFSALNLSCVRNEFSWVCSSCAVRGGIHF